MNTTLLLKHDKREELSELAQSRMRTWFSFDPERLWMQEFSLDTLRTKLLEGYAQVLTLSVPAALKEEIAATSRALEVGTMGWSLHSTPVYAWDLLGGSGGAWVMIGRIRA